MQLSDTFSKYLLLADTTLTHSTVILGVQGWSKLVVLANNIKKVKEVAFSLEAIIFRCYLEHRPEAVGWTIPKIWIQPGSSRTLFLNLLNSLHHGVSFFKSWWNVQKRRWLLYLIGQISCRFIHSINYLFFLKCHIRQSDEGSLSR